MSGTLSEVPEDAASSSLPMQVQTPAARSRHPTAKVNN
jgi:hypothetical protein